MKSNTSSFIVALDLQGGMAKDNKIPWHYPKDFAFFKTTTEGAMCLMGRNTFEEIATMRKYPVKNSSILPGRLCLVLTSSHIAESSLVKSISNIKDAKITYERSEEYRSFFYIGGLRIYDIALQDPSCTKGYITRFKKSYDCDTFFNLSLLSDNFHAGHIVYEDDDMVIQEWNRK